MNYRWKLTSSLEKIFFNNFDNLIKTDSGSMLKNEIYSFQLAAELKTDLCVNTTCRIEIESEIAPYISMYSIDFVANDLPAIEIECDNDYITKEPGLFPDPLHRIKDGEFTVVNSQVRGVWFVIEPKGEKIGTYPIKINVYDKADALLTSITYTIKIIDVKLPKQELLSTGWFHGDCIAKLHNTEIDSDLYYSIVDKYMQTYVKFGHNMILTPIFTPPLDTAIGKERPTNQLVDVMVNNGEYTFGFKKLDKWIDICIKNGIEYYEISHLFTQWGARNAPKIMATVDGEYKRIFGWETDGISDEYRGFIDKLMPALIEFLKDKGVFDNCYFHISDEPAYEHMERYKAAKEIISAYISEDKIFDALGEFRYYEEGVIKRPVVAIDHIKPFMEAGCEELWAYYCMAQRMKVANRFIAQPSYRNRILGYQLYKNNIKGFLQWGFNFWFTAGSQSVINPYLNSTAGTAFPGGDPFVVYPLDKNDEVVCSLRLYVFNEGLQDMRALSLLEKLVGRGEVIKMLDDISGFDSYPRNAEYILNLRERINKKIDEALI